MRDTQVAGERCAGAGAAREARSECCQPGCDGASLGLRDRKKRQTRVAIERAALGCVLERGLEEPTIEDICARAEVSRKTFFNYFASKEAALTGYVEVFPSAEEIVGELEEVFYGDARGLGRPGDYLDVVIRLIASNIAPVEDDEVGRMRQELMRSAPELFYRNHKGIRAVQREACAALGTFLGRHPEQRRSEGLTAEQEAFVAVSTALSTVRIASMLHAQVEVQPDYADLRRHLAAFISPDPR